MKADRLFDNIVDVLVDGGCSEPDARDKLNELLSMHHCQSCDMHACEEEE